MKQTEESLLQRNRLAASIGQDIVIETLKEFREQFVSQMKAIVPTQNDPYCMNLQRALGRVDACDYILALAERAAKPQSNKE